MQEKAIRACCPSCGRRNEENEELFHRDFSGMGELAPFRSYRVYVCARCGLVYAGHIEQNMPLDEYYAELSKYERPGWAASAAVSELDQQAAVYLHDTVLHDGGASLSVLDVGCGAGGMLAALKKRGYAQVCGIEPSAKNAQAAKDLYGIEVCPGNLEDDLPALRGRRFDVVAMKGVLEHILPLQDSIRAMLRYLKPGGHLYIEVPDVDLFVRHQNLYQEFSIEHVNFFNRYSLIELFRPFHLYLDAYRQQPRLDNIMTVWSLQDGSAGVRAYLAASKALAAQLAGKIKGLSGPFYLWGAGTHTAMLYQLGLVDDAQVEGIIDTNPNYTGRHCCGHVVLMPEQARPGVPILVSSQYAQDEIVRAAHETYHLANRMVTLYS